MVVDSGDLTTAAALGGALLAVLGVGGLIYNLFITTLGTGASLALAMMGVILFAVTVFVIQNRRKINNLGAGQKMETGQEMDNGEDRESEQEMESVET